MCLKSLLTASDIETATGGKIHSGDPRLSPLIEGVSQAIRRLCGWHVFPVIEETLILDTSDGSFLKLPTLNVIEITSLKIKGKEISGGFSWSRKGLIRLNSGRFPDEYAGVEVTLKHGFEEVPDIKQVAAQIIINALASPLGLTREQAGQVSLSWSQTAPGVSGGVSFLQRDLDVLAQYKLEETV